MSEASAIAQFELLQQISRALRPLGVRFGLAHAGEQLGRIARLPELGLDFVKLDAAVVHGIDGDAARAAFVRGLVTLLHGLAITVVADGVGRRRRRGCGLGLRRRWPGRVLGQRKER